MHSPKLLRGLKSRFSSRHSKGGRRGRRTTRRFAMESLEDRVLLSADPGWAFDLPVEIDEPTGWSPEINVGPDGNVYVYGSFSSPVDFGDGIPRTPTGLADAFVARYQPDSTLDWVATIEGADGDEYGRTVAFNPVGDQLFVSGYSDSSTTMFGSFSVNTNGSQDIYVAKLDAATGTFLSAKGFGGLGLDRAFGVAVDAGSVYVDGFFEGTVDFDPGVMHPGNVDVLTSGGFIDPVLIKLDANLNFQWVSQFSNPNNAGGHRVILDNVGNVFSVGAFFADTIQFTPTTSLASVGGWDAYLVKRDSTGSVQWVRHFASTGEGGWMRIGSDGANVYVTGVFGGQLDLTTEDGTSLLSQPLLSGGGVDTVVSKWDTNGNVVWAEQLTGSLDVRPEAIRVDDQGSPYIVGRFSGTADFDPDAVVTSALTSVGAYDGYLVKLSATGGFESGHQIAGSIQATATGVSPDGLDNVYVAGDFSGGVITPTADVFSGSSSITKNLFVLKVTPETAAPNISVSNDAPKQLQDAKGNNPRSTFSTLTVGESFTIQDLNVVLDISHTRDQDLEVLLTSPNGTTVELFSDVGGNGDHFTGTVLDDDTATNIATASAPFTGVFTPEAGSLSDFVGENALGTWTLEIVDDQKFEVGTLNNWSIIAVADAPIPNDPPTITSTPVTTGTQDAPYTYDVDATDPDVGDTLSFSLDSFPAGMTIDSGTGVIDWTPDSGQVGSNPVTVRAQDQFGAFDTQSFTIDVANVNDAPTITSSPITTGTEGVLYTYDVDANDPDVGDTLTYSLEPGAPSGMTIDSASGLIHWTPTGAQIGSHPVTVRAQDAGGLSDTQPFTIDVSETPAGVTVNGIMPSSMPANASGSVTINGSGFAAGASLTFTNGSGPSPNASNIVVAPDGLSITATVTTHKKAKVSAWDVVVTNPDGSTGTCQGCFSVTAGNSATSAAMESTAASFDASTSDDSSGDEVEQPSVTSPLPTTRTRSTSSTLSEPITASRNDADTVDEALSDFEYGRLDDALLEDLAASLVG